MRFNIVVKNVGTENAAAWREEYNSNEINTLEQARRWAMQLIAKFNNEEVSRYGREARIREVIGVEKIEKGTALAPHDWMKTNLVTKIARSGISFDTYRCRNCGCKGKRFGLNAAIVRDDAFSRAKWQGCPGKQGG